MTDARVKFFPQRPPPVQLFVDIASDCRGQHEFLIDFIAQFPIDELAVVIRQPDVFEQDFQFLAAPDGVG
jgi:hypothetical protein